MAAELSGYVGEFCCFFKEESEISLFGFIYFG